MKVAAIPSAVLALLVILILLSAGCLRTLGEGWTEAADALSLAALAGDTDGARQSLSTLERRWQQHRLYLELVLSHTSLDEVEVLLSQCAAQCDAGDTLGLTATAAELRTRLTQLSDSQQVLWGNIW